MNNIEETLEVLNEMTGQQSLSEEYIQLLNDANLQETDGYLIKLKLNDEVLSAKQTPESVIPRLHYLIEQLSKRRCHDNHMIDYEEKLITYLENQQDNKIKCEGCGCQLHFIDKYCYKCGEEQKTKITIMELLSSINSTYIKPGDIIRVNPDYSIDKTSYDLNEKRIKHEKVEDEINQLQYEQINKYNIQQFYKRILILNAIKNHQNPIQLTDKYHGLYDEEIKEIITNLIKENLVKKTLKDNIIEITSKINMYSNEYAQIYQLTQTGQMLLKNNIYIIFYYDVIYDSVADDIIEFEHIYRTRREDENLEDISDKLINILRTKYLEDNMHQEYNQSFNLEAYIHELFGKEDKIQILLKRFIINTNLNYGTSRTTPLDEVFISYLKSIILSSNITQNQLQSFFHQSYETVVSENIKLPEQESFNILLKCLKGHDINNLNFEIIQRYYEL